MVDPARGEDGGGMASRQSREASYDRPLGGLLGHLATGLVAGVLAILALRLALMPDQGLGPESWILWVSLLGGGGLLSLPWSSCQDHPRRLRAFLGLTWALLMVNTLMSVWWVGVPALWILPLAGALVALLLVALGLGAGTREPWVLGLTRPQGMLILVLAAFLALVGLVAWFGPGGQMKEAGLLLVIVLMALAVVLAWGIALLGLMHGRAVAETRRWVMGAILVAYGMTILPLALLYELLQGQSQHWVDVETVLGSVILFGVISALLWLGSLKRHQPLLLVAVWVLWALLVGRTHPTFYLYYMGYGSLILGLLLPARWGGWRWPSSAAFSP